MMGSPCRQSDEPNRARSRLFVSSRTFCLAQYRQGAARDRQPRDPLGRQTIFNEYLLRNGRQNLPLVSQTPRRRGSFVRVPSAPSAEFYEGSDVSCLEFNKKKTIYRLTTWQVLAEVDVIMCHRPGWICHDWHKFSFRADERPRNRGSRRT